MILKNLRDILELTMMERQDLMREKAVILDLGIRKLLARPRLILKKQERRIPLIT